MKLTRFRLMLGALGMIALGAIAYAQTVAVPQAPSVGPTDLIQIVPRGAPSAQSVYVTPAQVTSQSGYVKVTPATGFSYTFGNSQSYLAIAPSTTVAAGSVILAAAPSDGDNVCIYTLNTITALGVVANTGQTINNAVTTLAANASVCYLYSQSNLTWDRNR